mgnify:CR=1 FL=1
MVRADLPQQSRPVAPQTSITAHVDAPDLGATLSVPMERRLRYLRAGWDRTWVELGGILP